jgi:hypothetical protein
MSESEYAEESDREGSPPRFNHQIYEARPGAPPYVIRIMLPATEFLEDPREISILSAANSHTSTDTTEWSAAS